MIEIEDLTYSYPASDVPALVGISLQVSKGEFLGVVGPNKAGKSTLLLAMAGFVPHFYGGKLEGRVTVGGQSLADATLAELAGRIGLVFQDPFNQITGARFTVREEIAFGLENMGVARGEMEARIQSVLELMDMVDLGDRSPYALSGGQQQRLALASVLVMEPQVLLLDEPTSQLDPAGTQEVFSALRHLAEEREVTIVVAEHKLEWMVQAVDRVALLKDAELVNLGKPRPVLGDPQALDSAMPRTHYTQSAHQARRRGLIAPNGPLPVTLEQAEHEFAGAAGD